MATTRTDPTATVAKQLVDLCRQGRNIEAIDKLYSPTIESIESSGNAQMPARLQGIDAIRKKNEQWLENVVVNNADVKGPFVGDGEFAVQYTFDTTSKATGQRTNMTEMALYTVKDGRIVREQFFYNPTPRAD